MEKRFQKRKNFMHVLPIKNVNNFLIKKRKTNFEKIKKPNSQSKINKNCSKLPKFIKSKKLSKTEIKNYLRKKTNKSLSLFFKKQHYKKKENVNININKILDKKNHFLNKFKFHLKKKSRFSKKIKTDYFDIIKNIETQKSNNIIYKYKLKTFLMKSKKNKNPEIIFKRTLKENDFFKKIKILSNLKLDIEEKNEFYF